MLPSGRVLPEPFLKSMCLTAMSSDFFEIDLPKPPPSEVGDVLTDFLADSET